MPTTEHTPGPWQMHDSDHCPEEIWGDLEGPIDGGIRGIRICEVDFSENERGYANAKLICAAPKLAAALRRMADYCEERGITPLCLNDARAALAEAGQGEAEPLPPCENCGHVCPTDKHCPKCGGDPMTRKDRLCAACDEAERKEMARLGDEYNADDYARDYPKGERAGQ